MILANMIHQDSFTHSTPGRGTSDIGADVGRVVAAAGIERGTATVFVHHTSASLILCENADPAVRSDLEGWLAHAVPDGDPRFRHDDEGPDDMPAHVRAVLTATSLTIPVRAGQLDLGTWQGIYLYEHRSAPHRRRISVTVLGGATV